MSATGTVINVGDRVRSSSWDAELYVTVTAVGKEAFLGVLHDPKTPHAHTAELSYRFDSHWEHLPAPVPTVPAMNDVWVAVWNVIGYTSAAAWPNQEQALDYARQCAGGGRLVAVWRFPADGSTPERVEVTR